MNVLIYDLKSESELKNRFYPPIFKYEIFMTKSFSNDMKNHFEKVNIL